MWSEFPGNSLCNFAKRPLAGILLQVKADDQAPAGGFRGFRIEMEIGGSQLALAAVGMGSGSGLPAGVVLAVAAEAKNAGTQVAHELDKALIRRTGTAQGICGARR